MANKTDLIIRLVGSLFLPVLLVPTTAPGRIIYVDGHLGGANDGSSWADAYNYLQDALADANSAPKPVEIRVAEGTYKPDQSIGITSGDRQATFQLLNGVTIKGGYAGFGEADPNARDINQYETILSGDLYDDDVDVNDSWDLPYTMGWNSETVVTSSGTDSTAVLDRCTITGGCSSAVVRNGPIGGAGMFNQSGSPMLIHCTFTGNTSLSGGGGMYNANGSDPTLINCIFTKNYAYGGGAAMVNINSNPKLTACVFSDNFSVLEGAAMYNWGSSPTLMRCTFRRNSLSCARSVCQGMGGAIFSTKSSPTLLDSEFTDNTAGFGGAVCNDEGTNSTLTGCIFAGNCAEYAGGAIFDRDSTSRSMLTNCTFNRNSAKFGGGAMDAWGSTVC